MVDLTQHQDNTKTDTDTSLSYLQSHPTSLQYKKSKHRAITKLQTVPTQISLYIITTTQGTYPTYH